MYDFKFCASHADHLKTMECLNDQNYQNHQEKINMKLLLKHDPQRWDSRQHGGKLSQFNG